MTPQIKSALDTLVSAIREEAMADVFLALSRNGLPVNGAAKEAKASRATGEKRSPESIAENVTILRAAIAKTPGQRIEQISKALGIPTKDLALPVKKLLAAGHLKTKGQKRATTYFARGNNS